MNLKNYYWVFPSAFDNKFCNKILRLGKNQTKIKGAIGHDTPNKKDKLIKKIRNSNICFLDYTWIYDAIWPYVKEANKQAEWNFQWDVSQIPQFTEYKVGQYYGWHCDSGYETYVAPNHPSHGKIRKLSVTISLVDGSKYQGGDLEFDFKNTRPDDQNANSIHKCLEVRAIGSIVVFPSFVWHRVAPVTKGVRHSLVMWSLGYPLK